MAFSSVARLSTFLVVIPGLGYVMSKYFKLTRYVRDRVLVQVEGVLLLIGALCTALAPTVALAIGGQSTIVWIRWTTLIEARQVLSSCPLAWLCSPFSAPS